MAPSAVFLLLSLLSSAGSLPPPRISFLLDSADRPLVFFSRPDVHNTTTLLLSLDGSTLYVGARDALLSLDVSQSDVINLKKKVDWSPSEKEVKSCSDKGKDAEVDCPNFVRVLQPLNSTHLYACGSYAYSPHDAFIDTESFSMIVQRDGAKGRCPFSPFQRNTALTVDGELFTATMSDFRGVRPQISRHFSRGRPDVSQDMSVTLLEEPTFVGSSLDPSERKLYFFFSEVGKEFSYVDELRISRVAQVCKDDVGGQRTLQKKWTSFAKAPLLCRSAKQLPFSVLQDVFTLQPLEGSNDSDTLFYGVFTSQWSLGPESAVCVFRLQDVRAAFTGSYRTFNMQTHQWSPMPEKHLDLGKCGLDNVSDSVLAEVKKSFLTSNSIKPEGLGPLVVSSEHRYSRVAVMRTQAANGKHYTVLFLLTESGFIHKVVLFDGGAQVVEEIQIFTQPQPVKSIVLSDSKGVLYVGTSEGVTAVPVARCSIYRSCSQCVLARDPLCGWSRTTRACHGLQGGAHAHMAQDLEHANVEEQCQGQTEPRRDREISVHLNEAVKLPCLKPSNVATLSWTSPRIKAHQEKFIQSADSALSFFATADTFGTYRCEAEEGGFKEVIVGYNVRQVAPPRSVSPMPDESHPPISRDESYEDIVTETTETSTTRASAEPEDVLKGTTFVKEVHPVKDSTSKTEDRETDAPTSIRDVQVRKKQLDDLQTLTKEKSYHSELVVVSLLLTTCVCILTFGGLHVWRRRKLGLRTNILESPGGDSKTNQSMESIPSLSSPEDPELKVVE